MPKKIRRTNKPCAFCVNKTLPVWQDYDKMGEFLSARGRLLPRILTGVCVKHQRQLATAVKQARHLGLLPFTTLV